jgi:cytidylate kinase
MIIAIDGPAAAGKSTVARALAHELGLAFLDTGAMYRAVTLAVLEAHADPLDAQACARIAERLALDFDAQGRIRANGTSLEPAIRSEAVTRWVSAVAAHAAVRAAIVPQQRAHAERSGGVVAEGRDIGTIVFPAADHKFYLVASAQERARRRTLEEGDPGRFAAILADIERRDQQDSTRAVSPLAQAADAVRVDTDGLDAHGVVQALLAHVRAGRGRRESR